MFWALSSEILFNVLKYFQALYTAPSQFPSILSYFRAQNSSEQTWFGPFKLFSILNFSSWRIRRIFNCSENTIFIVFSSSERSEALFRLDRNCFQTTLTSSDHMFKSVLSISDIYKSALFDKAFYYYKRLRRLRFLSFAKFWYFWGS